MILKKKALFKDFKDRTNPDIFLQAVLIKLKYM